MRLAGKVVVVTGSTSGIGEAIARRCVREGARVLVHGLERGLGEALSRLSSDRELRLTHANLAYQRALQRFNADQMVDSYVALYHSLVSSGVAAA